MLKKNNFKKVHTKYQPIAMHALRCSIIVIGSQHLETKSHSVTRICHFA